MSDAEHLESLLKEAAFYTSQNLLDEADEKYREALQFLKERRFRQHEKIVEAIEERIRLVEKARSEYENAVTPPELSEEVQKLIKKAFAFSRSRESAAMEGAVALAKFGQYEAALAEFGKLLKKGILTIPAAKNMLRCRLNLSGPDGAISQFKEWVTREQVLSGEEQKFVRRFLVDLLASKGVEVDLTELGPAEEGEAPDEEMEAYLDITDIAVVFREGALKGKPQELSVTFQAGNRISVIVPAKEKALLEKLLAGTHLKNVQCYSPITLFKASAVVKDRSKIKEGPRRGDYTVDLDIFAE